MKQIIVLLVMMAVCVNCYAAEITFTIDNAKLQRIADALKGLFPIPQIPDPNWVNPNPEWPGSVAPLINEFTDNQWAKEVVRRWIISQVRRYEAMVAAEAAKANVVIDDSLVQ